MPRYQRNVELSLFQRSLNGRCFTLIYNENGDIVTNTMSDIFSIENISESLLMNLNEASLKNVFNSIREAKNKFIKILKNAIDNLIDLLINNVFSKNEKIKENKDHIIKQSENDIKFNGYIFNLYGQGGAIENFKTMLQLNVYSTIERYAYDNKPDFLNALRSISVNDREITCTEDNYSQRVKEFIYGSDKQSEYRLSDVPESIGTIVDRICDSTKTIRNLKSLYKDMKKYVDSENAAREKTYLSSDDMNDSIKRAILASNGYIKVCHTYMNILIPAIKAEYNQSYLICTRLLNLK